MQASSNGSSDQSEEQETEVLDSPFTLSRISELNNDDDWQVNVGKPTASTAADGTTSATLPLLQTRVRAQDESSTTSGITSVVPSDQESSTSNRQPSGAVRESLLGDSGQDEDSVDVSDLDQSGAHCPIHEKNATNCPDYAGPFLTEDELYAHMMEHVHACDFTELMHVMVGLAKYMSSRLHEQLMTEFYTEWDLEDERRVQARALKVQSGETLLPEDAPLPKLRRNTPRSSRPGSRAHKKRPKITAAEPVLSKKKKQKKVSAKKFDLKDFVARLAKKGVDVEIPEGFEEALAALKQGPGGQFSAEAKEELLRRMNAKKRGKSIRFEDETDDKKQDVAEDAGRQVGRGDGQREQRSTRTSSSSSSSSAAAKDRAKARAKEAASAAEQERIARAKARFDALCQTMTDGHRKRREAWQASSAGRSTGSKRRQPMTDVEESTDADDEQEDSEDSTSGQTVLPELKRARRTSSRAASKKKVRLASHSVTVAAISEAVENLFEKLAVTTDSSGTLQVKNKKDRILRPEPSSADIRAWLPVARIQNTNTVDFFRSRAGWARRYQDLPPSERRIVEREGMSFGHGKSLATRWRMTEMFVRFALHHSATTQAAGLDISKGRASKEHGVAVLHSLQMMRFALVGIFEAWTQEELTFPKSLFKGCFTNARDAARFSAARSYLSIFDEDRPMGAASPLSILATKKVARKGEAAKEEEGKGNFYTRRNKTE